MTTKPVTFPGWVLTLGAAGSTIVGLLIGVASAAWSARSMVAEQTAAIASLRQTLDQNVTPALAEIARHADRIAGHDTRLAVIEQGCCTELPRPIATAKP